METLPIPAEAELADEETMLGGLARRLAWVTVGAAIVVLVGSVTPPWLGLTVLAAWFVPLVVQSVPHDFAFVLAFGLAVAVGFREENWRALGFAAVAVLEECVLVLTVALLGNWLLL